MELAKNLELLPGDIVDLGCGYGNFLEELVKRHWPGEVKGVDCSPDLMQVCRSKGIQVLAKKVEEIGAGDISINILTCFEFLEHLFDPLVFLRGASRALRAGGIPWIMRQIYLKTALNAS